MRVPADKSLSDWIYKLIKENKIYKFYKTQDWIDLQREVMQDNHYECRECLKQGKYTRADCIHHVNEVRNVPKLALSRYYIDKDGNKQENLVPLCNMHHNIIHDKLGQWQNKDKFKNQERW